VVRAEGGDTHPPVGRLVEPVEGMEAELHPVQVRTWQRLAVGRERRHGRHQQARIEDGGVDALWLTRESAVIKSLNDADGREEPVARVAERREAPERLPAVTAPAVLVRHTGEGAPGLVVARGVRTGTPVEAAGMAVDDVGIHLTQGGFVAPQAP
jgi:hypothetical protein